MTAFEDLIYKGISDPNILQQGKNYMSSYRAGVRNLDWLSSEYDRLTPEAKAIYDKYQTVGAKTYKGEYGGTETDYKLGVSYGFGFQGDYNIERAIRQKLDAYRDQTSNDDGDDWSDPKIIKQYEDDLAAVRAIREKGPNAHLTGTFTDEHGNLLPPDQNNIVQTNNQGVVQTNNQGVVQTNNQTLPSNTSQGTLTSLSQQVQQPDPNQLLTDFNSIIYKGADQVGTFLDTYTSPSGRDKTWLSTEASKLTPEAKEIYTKYQKLVNDKVLVFPSGFGFAGDSDNIETKLQNYKDSYIASNTDASGNFTGSANVLAEFDKDIATIKNIRAGGPNAHLTAPFTNEQGQMVDTTTQTTQPAATTTQTTQPADQTTQTTQPADQTTQPADASSAVMQNVDSTGGLGIGKPLAAAQQEAATATQLPTGTELTPVQQTVQDDELLSLSPDQTLSDVIYTTDLLDEDEDAFIAEVPNAFNTSTYNATSVDDILASDDYTTEAVFNTISKLTNGEISAEEGGNQIGALVGEVQGTLSDESIAKAATAILDPKATVQFQMEQLFKSFTEGSEPPPWAAPAMRSVGAIMAQRGLGRSSMAAAAITQAALESGIQIAAQDANKYATIQLANLSNKQQAALQNAMTYASMDKANLDARLTAAVNNAKAFLSIDLTNAQNDQAMRTVEYNANTQKLFTDAAAANAASQFNAKSQNQVNEFFAELETQVSNSNATRLAAIAQFNADQTNSAARYFAKLNDSRQQFNATNALQISQSNAVWRRNINTVNTAAQNEANRINAANLLGIQQAALDRLWQKYRDEASWIMQANENDLDRAHQVAILSQQQDFNSEQFETTRSDSFYSSLGNVVMKGVFALLD